MDVVSGGAVEESWEGWLVFNFLFCLYRLGVDPGRELPCLPLEVGSSKKGYGEMKAGAGQKAFRPRAEDLVRKAC